MPLGILIVDDSPTARMFVQRCLEISKKFPDAVYLEASNGVEALRLLQDRDISIAVVFSDLNMPEMDGEMLLKRIQANPRLNGIPVVIVSSAANPAKDRQLLDYGAMAVIKKPVSPARLADVIGKLGDVGVTGKTSEH
jgi:two-component system, chemotaxis family, chemotaxis protein CheY